MLDAKGLQCRRGGRLLFDRLDFSLRERELVRVGGANGSGKTSLLRILCGLLAPEAGAVLWKGEPIRDLREEYSKEIVYLGHAPAVKDDLTAEENLRFSLSLAALQASSADILSSLEKFGVPPGASVKKLSQGQKRRAALARLALSARAPLWLLDEPLTALDKAAAALVEDLIRGHAANGGMVVFTTHQDARLEATRVVDLDA
jgi:heme exporter protein A